MPYVRRTAFWMYQIFNTSNNNVIRYQYIDINVIYREQLHMDP